MMRLLEGAEEERGAGRRGNGRGGTADGVGRGQVYEDDQMTPRRLNDESEWGEISDLIDCEEPHAATISSRNSSRFCRTSSRTQQPCPLTTRKQVSNVHLSTHCRHPPWLLHLLRSSARSRRSRLTGAPPLVSSKTSRVRALLVNRKCCRTQTHKRTRAAWVCSVDRLLIKDHTPLQGLSLRAASRSRECVRVLCVCGCAVGAVGAVGDRRTGGG